MVLNEKEYYESLCPVNKKAYNLFKEYKTPAGIFVETGCHEGNTLMKAAVAGYQAVYSCDINQHSVDHAINQIKETGVKYNIECRASEDYLRTILPALNDRVTFWLDAHGWGGGVPTFAELDIIREVCPRNDHTILIDDISIFFKDNLEDLKNKIMGINADYKIELKSIHALPDLEFAIPDGPTPDILVATIDEGK